MPELRIRRDDLGVCDLAAGESPRKSLADREAQLVVERFSLSANNITYAVKLLEGNFDPSSGYVVSLGDPWR